MPLYEYRCDSCSERFEELGPAQGPPPPCPHCGSSAVSRLLSTFSTRWKPSNVNWHRVG